MATYFFFRVTRLTSPYSEQIACANNHSIDNQHRIGEKQMIGPSCIDPIELIGTFLNKGDTLITHDLFCLGYNRPALLRCLESFHKAGINLIIENIGYEDNGSRTELYNFYTTVLKRYGADGGHRFVKMYRQQKAKPKTGKKKTVGLEYLPPAGKAVIQKYVESHGTYPASDAWRDLKMIPGCPIGRASFFKLVNAFRSLQDKANTNNE